ncbi:M23 family metallopeptidase [Flavobacterium sp. HSC-61S13]|uniref:M23 family metallopeptidase n=1 Tax=Flavobacterium sp. HSC-61S13 TaxID=2910963 RepID=UPI0020A047B2|nr:M23 family metallopeptidase [Flavobacterium sp. HSC-61S13]MCP1994908.1 murein DD-endopeptidase MepM/ murein hydrolase activator NlpD [Flavobacterium sp. HSC-61S13]
MSKVKYYYDSEKLAYQKVQPKKRKQIGFILLFIFSSAMFGLLGLIILLNTSIFETPRDKMQAREIENFKTNYAILNRKIDLIEQVLNELEVRDNYIYRSYFNTTPIPSEQRRSGFGGYNRYKDLEGFNNSELVKSTTKKVDRILKQTAIQSRSLDDIINLAKGKEKLLAAIPAIQPIKTEDMTRVASGFGYRTDPFTKIRKFHEGMDFSSKPGTPVYATGDGEVIRANNQLSGYGNLIEIKHGFGYLTRYAHLSKYNVKAGQKIKRGDLIGYVGNTGRSEAPHLHYEVHYNNEVMNPLNFYYGSISAKEFELLSQAANHENQSLD